MALHHWRGLRRWRWWWAALGVVLVTAALVRVTVTLPRINVRWAPVVDADARTALEQRYGLRDGSLADAASNTWQYGLGDTSRGNVRALVDDAAVADTAYLDRDRAVPDDARTIRVTVRYPFSDLFASPAGLRPLHRSLWLWLAGGGLLWAAGSGDPRRRRHAVVVAVLLVVMAGVAFPHDPDVVMMGGSADHTASRPEFESWFGGRVRFEKHLSQVALLELYLRLEPTEDAPARAVVAVGRAGTVWFGLSLLAVGVLERWSPLALRYLGLAVLAPSALLYFGWREFGYLSLSVAAFPLLARGVRTGDARLEAGGAVAGLGAALHGAGLVSLLGAWLLAAGAAAGRVRDRAARFLRVLAWGTTAYLGWVAIYVIVLKYSILPDASAAEINSWRPLLEDEDVLGRRNAAILSVTGARDLLFSGWVVGVPLLLPALSLWRRYGAALRAALWYLPPSLLFLIFRWPFDGVGGGMDLVVAMFPAFYALAWVCAHDPRRAGMAAAFLVSAHYAFWRVVLDERFQP